MRKKIPFSYIFLVGLVIGILMMNFGKNTLLDSTGLLDENTLKQMSSAAPDSSVLFVYVLRKRMVGIVALALAATTYLGVAACALTAGWYGMSAGIFLAAAVMRYGLKGVLLALAATMPQYLVYAPAIYGMLIWCEKTCRVIYGKGYYQASDTKTPAISGRVFSLLILLSLMLAGCALESFVNPVIFRGFLKMI